MYLYKNFLVVEREDKFTNAKNFVKNTLKIWFDDSEGQEEDVIIIIYPRPLNPTDTIREIKHSISFKFKHYENPIGFIKLHCNQNDFRVSNFHFETEPLKYLAMFKQYLINVIARLDLTGEDVDKEGFYLYFPNNLTPDWIKKLKTSHLIESSGKYKFRGHEVLPFLLINNWEYPIKKFNLT
uniref:Uncharacterized protein n=1 Tax=Iridovirus LCIVAC01 TaxID=2506607 RepID=A0A481YRY9_9VIRU|nr:MAG: hypothetical protein LCIVAC01_00330 [Iridovirus LCIVAC01]